MHVSQEGRAVAVGVSQCLSTHAQAILRQGQPAGFGDLSVAEWLHERIGADTLLPGKAVHLERCEALAGGHTGEAHCLGVVLPTGPHGSDLSLRRVAPLAAGCGWLGPPHSSILTGQCNTPGCVSGPV